MSHPPNLIVPYHGDCSISFSDLKRVADAVENMTYDRVAEFLFHLTAAFDERADSDERAGRVKLSDELRNVKDDLESAATNVERAWKVCRPYMKK